MIQTGSMNQVITQERRAGLLKPLVITWIILQIVGFFFSSPSWAVNLD